MSISPDEKQMCMVIRCGLNNVRPSGLLVVHPGQITPQAGQGEARMLSYSDVQAGFGIGIYSRTQLMTHLSYFVNENAN